jgi:hypothetical protein
VLVSASARAGTRLALVSSGHGERVQQVLALAEARLGQERAIELLDRRAIDRVLSEQQLTLTGLVDGNQAVALGKILAVDLFAVVETAPAGKEPLGLIIFDARTGVRLWDAALPGGGLDQSVATITGAVRTAVQKYAAGLKNVRTVCLLGVRNADLPREADGFCDFVALLVERRLACSPSVAVLERRRLDHLNRERTLAALPDGDLRAAVVLVQLEIGRAARGNGLRATVFLTDGKGKQLDRITVEVARVRDGDAADVAEPLVQAIGRSLQVSPGTASADRVIESGRFLREAQLMWSHKQLLQGMQAVESAQALDPNHPDNQATLAQYLLSYAIYLVSPNDINTFLYGNHHLDIEPGHLKTSLELAQRGVDTRLAAFARLQPRDQRALNRDRFRQVASDQALRSYINKLRYIDVRRCGPEAEGLLTMFRATVDRLLEAEFGAWADLAQKNPAPTPQQKGVTPPDSLFSSYSNVIRSRWEILRWNAPTAAAYTKTLAAIVARWLEVARLQEQGSFQLWHLTWFLEELTSNLIEPLSAGWKLGPDELTQAAAVFQTMEQHACPLIHLYGGAGRLLIGLKKGQLSAADAHREYQGLKKQALAWIQDPPARPADGFRASCYKFLAHTIERMLSQVVGRLDPALRMEPARVEKEAAPLVEELYELTEFMLGRNELVADVVTVVANDGGGTKTLLRRRLDVIDRALALAGSPHCRFLDGHPGGLQSSLRLARDQIVALHPELAGRSAHDEAGQALWQQARPLLDILAKPDGTQGLTAATRVGDHVYLVGGRADGPDSLIQLIDVPLREGGPRFLGRAHVRIPANALAGTLHLKVTTSCVANGHVYVATRTDGIVAFDRNRGAGRPIGTHQGLPSEGVSALASLGGKLYAALEGGYLITLDPEPLHFEVLASSRRKEKLSPFDDEPKPFAIPYLVADPERQRILFVLYQGTPATSSTVNGLWEFKPQTKTFTQRLRFTTNSLASWGSAVRGGNVVLSSPFFALGYDLASDKAYQVSSNAIVQGSRPDAPLFLTASPPHLLRDGWLWTSYPFGRIALNTGRQEPFPPPSSRKQVTSFSVSYLEPVGADQLLIGDHYGLWLVTLPGDKRTSNGGLDPRRHDP